MPINFESFQNLVSDSNDSAELIAAIHKLPQKDLDEFVTQVVEIRTLYSAYPSLPDHRNIFLNLFFLIAEKHSFEVARLCFDKLSYAAKLKVLSNQVSSWHTGKITFEYLPRVLPNGKDFMLHIMNSLDAISLVKLLEKFNQSLRYHEYVPANHFEGFNEDDIAHVSRENPVDIDLISWRCWAFPEGDLYYGFGNREIQQGQKLWFDLWWGRYKDGCLEIGNGKNEFERLSDFHAIFDFISDPKRNWNLRMPGCAYLQFNDFLQNEIAKIIRLAELTSVEIEEDSLQLFASLADQWQAYIHQVLSIKNLLPDIKLIVNELQAAIFKLQVSVQLIQMTRRNSVDKKDFSLLFKLATEHTPHQFTADTNYHLGLFIYSLSMSPPKPDSLVDKFFAGIKLIFSNEIFLKSVLNYFQPAENLDLSQIAYDYLKESAKSDDAAKQLLFMIVIDNLDEPLQQLFLPISKSSKAIELIYPASFTDFKTDNTLFLSNIETDTNIVDFNLENTLACWKQFLANNSAASSRDKLFKPYSHPFLKPLENLLTELPLEINQHFLKQLNNTLNSLSDQVSSPMLSDQQQKLFAKLLSDLKKTLPVQAERPGSSL